MSDVPTKLTHFLSQLEFSYQNPTVLPLADHLPVPFAPGITTSQTLWSDLDRIDVVYPMRIPIFLGTIAKKNDSSMDCIIVNNGC